MLYYLIKKEQVMFAIRLPEQLEERLESLAKRTGRTKTFYAKKAIEQIVEDMEDYLFAEKRLRENNPSATLSEVGKRLGLDD
jgi:RHH-type rel operon transcriptional repressor/antitoxin RelB